MSYLSTLSSKPAPSAAYLAEYEGTRLIIIASVFISVEVAFVCLRTYSRSLMKTRTGLDDILIWLSLIVCLSLNALAIIMVKYAGVGRHEIALVLLEEDEKIVIWTKCIIVIGWLYMAACTLPKLCVLLLYYRVFDSRPYKLACYFLGIIMIGNFLASGIIGTLGCRPLKYFWDKSGEGECINIDTFLRWVSFPNIVTDLGVMILPLPLVWTLNATLNEKLSLTITFFFGSVGLVSSVLRFHYFFTNDILVDSTMTGVTLVIWTLIEPGMYFIAACLLRFKPLIQTTISTIRIGASRNYATEESKSRSRHRSNTDNSFRPFGAGGVVVDGRWNGVSEGGFGNDDEEEAIGWPLANVRGGATLESDGQSIGLPLQGIHVRENFIVSSTASRVSSRNKSAENI